MNRKRLQWIFVGFLPAALAFHFYTTIGEPDQRVFMPGGASHGHHQIEMKCAACHTENMGVKHDACVSCHQEELDRVNDSHPVSKFLDPRNADRIAILDARKCSTCHVEHQKDQTLEMGLTLPTDYCYFCHQDIEENRPTHAGLGFDTCATAGCHNYHDNSALYEDFLERHSDDTPMKPNPSVPLRSLYENWAHENQRAPLTAAQRDAPADVSYSQNTVYDWASTAHANAGVNCTDCHNGQTPTGEWSDTVGHNSCQSCHAYESETFLQGRHGMRLAQDLSPMTPAQAKIPMHANAAHKQLSCISCHGDHTFDTSFAAVNACISCHDDTHTRNYKNSKHYQLWLAESSGAAPAGSGVSCATCHMPRLEVTEFGETKIKISHNQNDFLRPNEKMIRPVCTDCHGLGFAIDSLADPNIIEGNFQTFPDVHIESIDMVLEKLQRIAAERN